MKRILIFCLALLFFFQTFAAQIFASEYFGTSYFVTYDIADSGSTRGTVDVTLTNKTSDYYASSYKVQLGFDDVRNVTARDGAGNLKPKVTKTEDGTIIEAEFNEKVVGKDEALTYTITFETDDIAQKNGSLLSVNVPGISDPNAFDAFSVKINPPETYLTPYVIKPATAGATLEFSKDALGTSGISLAFGDKQDYLLNLDYHLENKQLFPVETEIALPPTTNYQDVYIAAIEPKPENVVTDADGNWLAKYKLMPGEKKDINVKANVVVRIDPKPQPQTTEELKPYLKEDDFWEVSNPEIRELAKKLKTPRAIYDYVVENLNYDFSRVEGEEPRLGGAKTLSNPDSAVCLEFTDLFVTLARAAGIPAREVDGYAYTQNERQRPLSLEKDILHAWPEYYDDEKQTWIMVDPTWGNTTGGVDYFDRFDYDHITLVIKGHDSQYPVPAGGYKTEGSESVRDISVSFDPQFELPEPKLSFSIAAQPSYYTELPIVPVLIVRNPTGVAIPETQAEVSSNGLSPELKNYTIPIIPPYGFVEIPLEFAKKPLLTNESYDFTIQIADEVQSEEIRVVPIFLAPYVLLAGGLILGILAIIIFIFTRRTRSLPLP